MLPNEVVNCCLKVSFILSYGWLDAVVAIRPAELFFSFGWKPILSWIGRITNNWVNEITLSTYSYIDILLPCNMDFYGSVSFAYRDLLVFFREGKNEMNWLICVWKWYVVTHPYSGKGCNKTSYEVFILQVWKDSKHGTVRLQSLIARKRLIFVSHALVRAIFFTYS